MSCEHVGYLLSSLHSLLTLPLELAPLSLHQPKLSPLGMNTRPSYKVFRCGMALLIVWWIFSTCGSPHCSLAPDLSWHHWLKYQMLYMIISIASSDFSLWARPNCLVNHLSGIASSPRLTLQPGPQDQLCQQCSHVLQLDLSLFLTRCTSDVCASTQPWKTPPALPVPAPGLPNIVWESFHHKNMFPIVSGALRAVWQPFTLF